MNRRNFVKKSGLAATGVLAGASLAWSSSLGYLSNSTINIGVIGTGSRGSGLIPLLNDIEGINVSGCCDVLPFRLEDGILKTGSKAKGYTDYRNLLDDKALDAVLIATPFSTHAPIAIDALDAGKHVYCEKTMAKGYQDIHRVLKKVNQSSTIFQTGHQYHSSRLYSEIVESIKAGKIGKIISFECQWNRNGDWRRPVSDPSLEKAINWRMYREFSGGLVAELCSHQIDFVNWVLDETPEQIVGIGGIDYWKDGRETYDNVHLVHSYPNGVKATFRCLTANALNDYKIKVHGDKGTIVLDYTDAWIYYENQFEDRILGDVDGVSGATVSYKAAKGEPIAVKHADPSKQALIDFRDSILKNEQPLSNALTGANTARAVQMSLDAMHENRIMYWSDLPNLDD